MSRKGPHHSMMYENLMMVDEEGFNNCTVDKNRNPELNREILRCDGDPKKFKYTEEIFSTYRAFTDQVKYTFGKYYYFICKYEILFILLNTFQLQTQSHVQEPAALTLCKNGCHHNIFDVQYFCGTFLLNYHISTSMRLIKVYKKLAAIFT